MPQRLLRVRAFALPWPALLPGDLERGAGPGRALEEAIDDRAAAQQAALLLGLPVELDITVGQVEDVVDVVRRQALDPEQMPMPERGLRGAFVHEPETIECPLSPRNDEVASMKIIVASGGS